MQEDWQTEQHTPQKSYVDIIQQNTAYEESREKTSVCYFVFLHSLPAIKKTASLQQAVFSFPKSGADGDRTHGLMNAIHALSQLSYGPNSD